MRFSRTICLFGQGKADHDGLRDGLLPDGVDVPSGIGEKLPEIITTWKSRSC